jgi:hypothetical protein
LRNLLERNRVIRQGFFRHQVSHQDHQQIIGDPLRRLTKLREIVRPLIGREIRQVVGRLPGLFDRGQKKEILPHKALQTFKQFHSRTPFSIDRTDFRPALFFNRTRCPAAIASGFT